MANKNPALDFSKSFNVEYIKKNEEGLYFIDDLLIKLELYNFMLEESIYKNGISIMKHYNQKGIATTVLEFELLEGVLDKAKKITFKEAFIKYAEVAKNPFNLFDVSALVSQQPLIVEAYNKLGEDRVGSFRYVKKAVENALISFEEDKNTDTRIAKILNNRIRTGFNSNSDIKSYLAEAYFIEGISKAIKATDIKKYFDCTPTSKRVDGKVTKEYEVYRIKFIFR